MKAIRLIKWALLLTVLAVLIVLAAPLLLVARYVVPFSYGEFVEDFAEQLGRNCAVDLHREG